MNETHLNKIIQGDYLELFENISDNSIDITFADHPFNLKKKYNIAAHMCFKVKIWYYV